MRNKQAPEAGNQPAPKDYASLIFWRAVQVVWVVTVLVWPVLKWIISINAFFHFIRMMYHWNTPGTYAGWNFLGHFAFLTALTYFVSVYKPKGIETRR